MPSTSFVVDKIPKLYTFEAALHKGGRKPLLSDMSLIENAAMVVKSGKVAWTGPRDALPKKFLKLKKRKAQGHVIMPALVDPHTHLVFAGDRSHEFEMRLNGATYQEIADQGGGIQNTMRSTRAASKAELLRTAEERLKIFLKQGVTTIEIKSGYGLTLEDELKCLEVAKKLESSKHATIVKTFLSAHALPPEFKKSGSVATDHDNYTHEVSEKWLPQAVKRKLVDQVDIFVDKGYFSVENAKVLFEQARKLKVPIKIHSDEFEALGATELASEMKALSADHLLAISESGIKTLSKSETTAVLLPTTALFLKADYAPARKLIDGGCRVALGTDFNPGSSPTQDISLVSILAATQLKMSIAEILVAHTVNAAFALGIENQKGSLAVGHDADFIELVSSSPAELIYNFGYRRGPHSVWHRGLKVV